MTAVLLIPLHIVLHIKILILLHTLQESPVAAALLLCIYEAFKDTAVSVSSTAVSFPCGLQQMEALYQGRSLWTLDSDPENVNMETNNITDSWEPKLNLTDEETTTVNATVRKRGGNETVLTGEEGDAGEDGGGEDGGGQEGEEVTPRIVGGMLEKPGGSPWQVQETETH